MPGEGLEGLDLPHVRNYLGNVGWQPIDANERRELWGHPDTERRLLVPIEPLADYGEILAELLGRLAAEEKRSEEDVLIDLSWPGYDKLVVRTMIDSPIPAVQIDEALGLNDAFRDLVVAGARSSENRRRYHQGGWTSGVSRYIDGVRMIPSRAGSYALRALLPINDDPPEQILFPEMDTPSVRAATTTLVAAVGAARDAVEARVAGADDEVFDAAVETGVSAELLDALARLAGSEERTSAFELNVGWTYAAPAPTIAPIRFEAAVAPVLERGAQYLRGTPDEIPVVITGIVIRLHREDQLGAGEITVRGFVDGNISGGTTRSVTMELDEPTYQAAIAAHQRGDTVRVRCVVRPGRILDVVAVRELVATQTT